MNRKYILISKILDIVIVISICLVILCMFFQNKREKQDGDNLTEIAEEAAEVVQTASDSLDNSEYFDSFSDSPLIRVALMQDDFSSVYHDAVELTCEGDFIVQQTVGEEVKSYQAGTVLNWQKTDVEEDTIIEIIPEDLLVSTASQVLTAQQKGIRLLSLTRDYGHPGYLGNIQLHFTRKGIVIVNTLPVEVYLCFVVPSEIPAESQMESIKAQAVCARSYAWKKLQDTSAELFDVTDSTSDQVYNNQQLTKDVCQAVADTVGEVLQDENGEIVSTYYYSTSWGYTSDTSVWGSVNNICTMHLDGKAIDGDSQDNGDSQEVSAVVLPDVTTESGFRDFYHNWENYTNILYDADAPWFRWTINCDKTILNQLIQEKMQSQNTAYADSDILKYQTASGEQLSKYQNILKAIQKSEIDKMKVEERGSGGAVNQIQVSYDSGDVLEIFTVNAVREWFGSPEWQIDRSDGTAFTGWSILPSAFFYIEQEGNSIKFYGGGFGHGAGMSQNGARAMGVNGIKYDEILRFFYQNVQIQILY